jgi:hypothetical protein
VQSSSKEDTCYHHHAINGAVVSVSAAVTGYASGSFVEAPPTDQSGIKALSPAKRLNNPI